MSFSSIEFVFAFLPIFIFGYFILAKINYNISKIWTIILSFVFYSFYNHKLALFLACILIINTFFSYLLTKKKSKVYLSIGVIFNIAVLLFFKYFNFFIDSVNTIFSQSFNTINIVAPLGISFITFKCITSIVEIYKSDINTFNVLNYMSYISFFPQIISGPISEYKVMNSAIGNKTTYKFNCDNFSDGIFIFVCGLAKKALLANKMSAITSVCFAERVEADSTLALIGILAYSLEIYFDFSGYTDMANGVCYMMNIPATLNFNSPYKAVSITDFWKRWHISLTKFLTKYVYIPLGGNRKGKIRTYINVLIVFLVSGLWHGSAWTFVLWGGLHGLLMVIDRAKKEKFGESKLPVPITRFITFILVSLLWLVFRCENLGEVKNILLEISALNFNAFPVELTNAVSSKFLDYFLEMFNVGYIANILPYFWLILGLVITQLPYNSDKLTTDRKYVKNYALTVIIAILAIVSIVSTSTTSTFIYWNF